jgi:hypothetical protein
MWDPTDERAYLGMHVTNVGLNKQASVFTQDFNGGPANGGTYEYIPFGGIGARTMVLRSQNWHHIAMS